MISPSAHKRDGASMVNVDATAWATAHSAQTHMNMHNMSASNGRQDGGKYQDGNVVGGSLSLAPEQTAICEWLAAVGVPIRAEWECELTEADVMRAVSEGDLLCDLVQVYMCI
jgi:hypothetical protein